MHDYFTGIAAGGRGLVRAQRLAQPNSPAAVFAEHHSAVERAQGGSERSASVGLAEDAVQWSSGLGSHSRETQEFTGFLLDSRGRLVDWTVDGGRRLGDSVAALGGPISAAGATIDPITAYRTKGGDLQITYRVQSSPQISVSAQSYTSNGRAWEPDSQPYSFDPATGSSALGWSVVEGSDWPGQLIFSIDYDTTVAVPVPTPKTMTKGNTP